ncbi:hypothetical protein D1AOALGA4SA_10271 [Olavius algarvensis Delta 1 endosymbiont]|nr:hypothetical protein D1AOALGA4SA_10271 [Olavius algarvensis Delta 1 endosymbiont]
MFFQGFLHSPKGGSATKKVIMRLYEVIEKFRSWSTGELEYWGIIKPAVK